jgi:NAD(P)-dependent dehydrogenase (short-subunit alcohol dehydrogenase family)
MPNREKTILITGGCSVGVLTARLTDLQGTNRASLPGPAVLDAYALQGIGLELVKQYAKRPGVTVIASVRKLEFGAELEALSSTLDNGSRIIVVKIDNQVDTDAKEAVEFIKKQGVDSLDLVCQNAHCRALSYGSRQVIANSGIAWVYDQMAVVSIEKFREQ